MFFIPQLTCTGGPAGQLNNKYQRQELWTLVAGNSARVARLDSFASEFKQHRIDWLGRVYRPVSMALSMSDAQCNGHAKGCLLLLKLNTGSDMWYETWTQWYQFCCGVWNIMPHIMSYLRGRITSWQDLPCSTLAAYLQHIEENV